MREAHAEMLRAGLDEGYAKTVTTYLAFTLNRWTNNNSTLTRLMAAGARGIIGTFARQALPMVWDYAEANPFGSSASWSSALPGIVDPIAEPVSVSIPTILARDARLCGSRAQIVLTDPPYYDAINYSDLSDFFYVWLKRSVGFLYPELLSLPLTPKKNQIVMNVYGSVSGTAGNDRKAVARRDYIQGMAEAFKGMSQSLGQDGLVGVVFAHTDPEAWATLLEGLLHARLVPDASWPIDTEQENKASGQGQARLATSVWMACRPRERDAGEAFVGDVMAEMRPIIRDRLLYFWSKGIRGADFFISAIGPALSVFGRHGSVLRPDGTEVTVRDFLDLVRRESTQVALEQVLQGADLGVVDPVTRQYVTWVWSYSRTPLDSGEALALCLATGTDYHEVVRPASIAIEAREGSKKVVKLRSIKERGRADEHLGEDTAARPAPLIDQLQYAAHLWGLNRADELAQYRAKLGETRWAALRTLGQAVAECLPVGDEDRRLLHGLLGSSAMGIEAPRAANGRRNGGSAGAPRLPGMEEAPPRG